MTGCEDAAWCALAGLVMDGDMPRQVNGLPDGRLFLVPTADIAISPTWQGAAAMRGTGSHAVCVNESSYLKASPILRQSHARLIAPCIASHSRCCLRPPVLPSPGALDTAVASAREALGAKVSSFSGQTIRDQTPIQELIAHSSAALRAARAGLFAATNAVWDLASTGAEVPLPLRAELYASAFYVWTQRGIPSASCTPGGHAQGLCGATHWNGRSGISTPSPLAMNPRVAFSIPPDGYYSAVNRSILF